MAPIEMKDFEEKGTEVTERAKVNRKADILAFLKKNKKKAFTQKEIAESFEIQPTQARMVLMSLVEAGAAERKAVNDGQKTLIFYAYLKDLEAETPEPEA